MDEAAKDLGMSRATLQDHLRAVLPDTGTIQDVTKFGTGQSNPTYKIETETGALVLRSQPAGELLPSAHAVDREFRVMQALSGTPVPVPPAFHYTDRETSPSGRGFYIMGLVPGRIFWDPALPDETARAEIYDAMNATLAALHDVDTDAVGLADFGKPGNYFARQLDRWTRQYHASTDAPSADMLAIIDWLETSLPADDGQVSLVHGDWRIDNLMFDPDTPTVAAVLDWELSTLGHPMADLAYQCMQWRLPNAGKMRGLAGVDRMALGLPDEDSYVASYARRRGIKIENWPFYLVFSFFRLAAILAGVAARAEGGNASNPALAREYGKAVPVLAAMALQVTRTG